MPSAFRTVVFLALFGTGSTLFGCWPYGCYWGSPYLGTTCLNDDVPYFAAHPPVYYSHVVARPYGWSPFPYPLDSLWLTREPAPQPKLIVNRFVPQAASPQVSASQSRSPLRIVNPFVQQSNGVVSSK